jgi:hypothetical protein
MAWPNIRRTLRRARRQIETKQRQRDIALVRRRAQRPQNPPPKDLPFPRQTLRPAEKQTVGVAVRRLTEPLRARTIQQDIIKKELTAAERARLSRKRFTTQVVPFSRERGPVARAFGVSLKTAAAAAISPPKPRAARTVLQVGPRISYLSRGILRHEIGHQLMNLPSNTEETLMQQAGDLQSPKFFKKLRKLRR